MKAVERAVKALASCRTVGQVWVAIRYAILAVERDLPAVHHGAALEVLDELTDRQLRRIRRRRV
jgi:hypothetical protein